MLWRHGFSTFAHILKLAAAADHSGSGEGRLRTRSRKYFEVSEKSFN